MGNINNKNKQKDHSKNKVHRKSSFQDTICMSFRIGSSKKSSHQSSSWYFEFSSYCKTLKNTYKWADIVRQAGKQIKQTRVINMREFQQLKYQHARKSQNHDIPNEPQMRQLLKTSALLLQNISQEQTRKQSIKSIFSRASIELKEKDERAKLMVSIFNQNMKSLFEFKSLNDEQTKSAIFLFVKFTELLQRHSQDTHNAICNIRVAFITYINKVYQTTTSLSSHQNQQLTTNIRAFIDLYTVTIDEYYKPTTHFKDNEVIRQIFSLENIKSVATVILFKIDGFYKKVFKLYESLDKPIKQKLIRIIKIKNKLNPEDLQVAAQYCLNKLTLNWSESQNQSEKQNSQDSQSQLPSKQINYEPFQTCILKLKQIEQGQSPISKLKVIISTADKITGSIMKFYKLNNINSSQMVDADQVLSIFMYIILKAQIFNLHTHLQFIKNFCTQQQLLSETGYYSEVATCALKMIIEQFQDEVVST